MASISERYFRTKNLPHIFCPGCGHGTVMSAIARAMDQVGVDQDRTVVVSGIGCSSRVPGYMDFDTLHTTHGRALAFATGVKMAEPDLKVVVVTGDGDMSSIGGNHLIHAARRNIDITTICFNNSIYGMTGGQYSPMTPAMARATTSPYGNVERSFDLCQLVKSSGGTYVARATAYHVRLLIRFLAEALMHKGFSFVEAISQCPTYFGRRNRMASVKAMLEWQRDKGATLKQLERMDPKEQAERFAIGVLHREEAPEHVSQYDQLAREVRERSSKDR